MKTVLSFVLLFIFCISCAQEQTQSQNQKKIVSYKNKLEKIPEYINFINKIKNLDYFRNFPAFEAWRFLLPGKIYSHSPLVLEKSEPGYLAGMARGMIYGLENNQQKLSVEFLESLRQQATKHVKKLESGGEIDTQTPKYDLQHFEPLIGGVTVSFRLVVGSNASQAGIDLLRKKIAHDPIRFLFKKTENSHEKLYFRRVEISRENLYPRIQKIILNYESNYKNLNNIIILCQNLLQLHPFNDGNTRTLVVILIQKELARNNFKPVLLENPKRFAGYTPNELLILELNNGLAKYNFFNNLDVATNEK